jgi:hypothetical protein
MVCRAIAFHTEDVSSRVLGISDCQVDPESTAANLSFHEETFALERKPDLPLEL